MRNLRRVYRYDDRLFHREVREIILLPLWRDQQRECASDTQIMLYDRHVRYRNSSDATRSGVIQPEEVYAGGISLAEAYLANQCGNRPPLSQQLISACPRFIVIVQGQEI